VIQDLPTSFWNFVDGHADLESLKEGLHTYHPDLYPEGLEIWEALTGERTCPTVAALEILAANGNIADLEEIEERLQNLIQTDPGNADELAKIRKLTREKAGMRR
jgi:hypothetical protein